MQQCRGAISFAVMLVLLLASAADAIGPLQESGGSTQAPPAALMDIGVTEHLGDRIPLDLAFTDESGQSVRLGDYFESGKPVVLQLGYYECPMLCTMISQGMIDALKQIDLKMGEDFHVVNISVDPTEQPKLAELKKRSYISAYGKPGEAGGMHLLVGGQEAIEKITSATGFRYQYVAEQEQYSHPAVLIIMTPDGYISRYLYGVKFDPKTLRLSLVEASANKIGSAMDQILLVCFHYDDTSGQYTLAAFNIMRIAGVLTLIVLVVALWRLFARDRKPHSAADADAKL